MYYQIAAGFLLFVIFGIKIWQWEGRDFERLRDETRQRLPAKGRKKTR